MLKLKHTPRCSGASLAARPCPARGRGAEARAPQRIRSRPSAQQSGTVATEAHDGAALHEILDETQRHLLDINARRVKLVEELALAHRRIAELEHQVERLRQEAAGPSPAALQAIMAAQQGSRSRGSTASVAASDPGGGAQQPPGQPASGTIRIGYVSKWHDAFIHYSADGKGWTQSPGVRLKGEEGRAPTDNRGRRVIEIPARRVVCCFTDGHDQWDANGGTNYVLDGPGNYLVQKGRVERE